MIKSPINYKTHCPHLKEVTRERGDFEDRYVGKRKYSHWVSKEKWTELIPCGANAYEILQRGIFAQSSGYDPLGLEVKCKNCGGTYYLFPKLPGEK